MSLDVTIRQKAIQICASAAICGLSISFLLGEIADQKARLIHSWKSDPRLLPTEYSVLLPLSEGARLINAEVWQEKLIAYNQISLGQEKEAIAFRQAAMEKSEDEPYVTADAPPEPNQNQSEISIRDVETILSSIHQVAKDLVPPENTENSAKILVSEQKQKQDARLGYAPATETASAGEASPKTSSPSRAPEERRSAVWTIAGKILTDAKGMTEAGHYEIGLFSKIDPEGNPIGFPFVQQILPAGKRDFRLSVPVGITRGYLFGEFVSARVGRRVWIPAPLNPILKNDRNAFAELVHRMEDSISTVAASVRQEAFQIAGQVSTMFSKEATLPQADVVVKVRGRKEATRTQADGTFKLSLPPMKGAVYLEFLKGGYHPVVLPVTFGEKSNIKVELASRQAIDKIAGSLGIRQVSTKGVFIGMASAVVKGTTAQMSLKADGPFYFSEEGYPGTDKRGTTADGRFIFFNVEPGAGFVEIQSSGESLAPFQISFVEGGELVSKQIIAVSGKIKGRVFNPIRSSGKLTPLAGARVRMEGGSESSVTDSYGAFSIGPVKFVRGEEIGVEVSAERFYNHRYKIKAEAEQFQRETYLFAFPAQYISKLANSMDIALDPYAGVVLGRVSGASVRIDALSDHSPNNSARDFYFDKKGSLLGSHQLTDPQFGTYIIFNVPRGRTLLQGNDAHGVTRYSDAVSLSASSITVVMD